MTLETVLTEKQDFIKKFSSVCPTESKKQSRRTDLKSTKVDIFPRKSSNQSNTLSNLLNRLSEHQLPGSEHVKQYLFHLNRLNRRPNTLKTHFTPILFFLMFLQTAKVRLEEITRNDLGVFIEQEQDRGLKPLSVQCKIKSLCAFIGFLAEREIVNPDVLKKRFRIKVPDSLPRAMDPDDVKAILSVIKDVRNRAMILVLLRTGMRIGELLATKVIDIDLKGKKIMIFEAQKNRVGRVVYLSDDAKRALKVWLKKRDPQRQFLFYSRARDSLCYETARTMFKNYLDKAHLSHRDYTLHCLRHTFASELLNAGMRLECLQQLLGHENIEMTRRYARLTDNTRREEYFNAMSKIEKGEIHGHYQFDFKLQEISEEKELLD